MVSGTPTTATPQRFSTRAVPHDQRLHRWEEYNERELFGLRVSTLAQEGLLATQTNLELGRVRVAEISGNSHVIERTPRNIAALPGDAIMLCLLVQGEAFVYHSDGCDPVRAGDAVLYDIDRPFMYGFSGAMHQVMLELPRALFHGRIGEEGVIRPRVLRFGDHDHTREWARSAARVIRRAIHDPGSVDDALEESLIDLHALLMSPWTAPAGSGFLLAAKEYIRANLGDPALSLPLIASAVGVSERHLSRLFAEDDLTVAGYVLDQRLSRARDHLADPGRATMSIAQVARSVGFVSPAHFTRAFRTRFDCTPTQARKELHARSVN